MTIADSLSSFFSISATRDGVCTTLGFVGLLRATCSIHSTLAFWHLEHVLCRRTDMQLVDDIPLTKPSSFRRHASYLVLSTTFTSKRVSYSSLSSIHGDDRVLRRRLRRLTRRGLVGKSDSRHAKLPT